MITDRIENCEAFSMLGSRFECGFRFLRENDLRQFPDGKHEIEGEDVYVIISSYTTKSPEESHPEAHRLYADIQYMIRGSEIIAYDLFNDHKVYKEYDPEKDFLLYEAVQNSITLREGTFAVFFPQDIHQPGLIINEPAHVKKAVVKVRLG
ncbi:MAG TPA: YhcH/YjgK/YiaL family protein [Ignavibacteria bacterium]|nr:YhcH/YjgK/YiaL family protein [Ignavibacteria bacterium]